MLKKRPAKANKINKKVSVAVIAGVAGVGTMFCMVPASFADTLASNNKSQTSTSKAMSSALKLSGLQSVHNTLNSISMVASMSPSSLDEANWQTQSKQQDLAKNLSTLTSNLEGVLQGTSYISKLSSLQSALEGVESTLKAPNLPNSQLEGSSKTQGELQNLVGQLQSIISEASAQYGAELKNAVNDYNGSNLPATEAGVANAIKAAKSVYTTASAANNPDLSSANNAFSQDAGEFVSASGNASESTSIVGQAELTEKNANAQLDTIQDESKALYNKGDSSSASGSLVTDAKNFDSWAKSWIGDANAGKNSKMGYTQFLNEINTALSDITAWQANKTLEISNQADASTVEYNLKIMKSAVESLQSLMGNLDTASLSPEDAYSSAWQDALSGEASATFPKLQTFLQDSKPISHGGGSGTVPSSVSTYGGKPFNAWPANNPFVGSNATNLWSQLSSLQAQALGGNLPSMSLGDQSSIYQVREAWQRDWANYNYLQSINPYLETVYYDATQVLSSAKAAAAKISAAKQLADQNTGTDSSDSQAASQAQTYLRDALTDVESADTYGSSMTEAMSGAYTQWETGTSSTPTVKIVKSLAQGGKSTAVTVNLPTQTTEPSSYSQSDVAQTKANFMSVIASSYQSISGSTSGNGNGGLIGKAALWQKAIVTQGVFNNAQKAYDGIQKVQQDLNNIKSAADPGAASGSLKQLQSDLTPLINSTQEAIEGMQSASKSLQALGQASPYTQSDIDSAQTPLTSSMALASASSAQNPIQKAIENSQAYNAGHPVVAGFDELQPTISTLIGSGNEPGMAQKILSLPFRTVPAASVSPSAPQAPSPASAAPWKAMPSEMPQASGMMPTVKMWPAGEMMGARGMKVSQREVQVQGAKPKTSNLATTGSDVEAIGGAAAAFLAVGIAAELLKKKKGKKND